MPQAADLVINDGQGTPVARTFSLYAPASGYGGIAEWRYKNGANASVFPTITWSAERDARRSMNRGKGKLRVPQSYVDSTTGLTKAGSAMEMNLTVACPDDFPEALKADFAAFAANMLNHALFKAGVIRDATPMT